MVDGQFSSQNGNGSVNPSGNGSISVIVAPSSLPAVPGPNQDKWIQAEAPKGKPSAATTGKRIQIMDEMSVIDKVVLFGAELCGTAILVYMGCASCLNFTSVGGAEPTLLNICLAFGISVMLAVQCFGHVSGCHINPTVTVAALTLGNIPLSLVPIYFGGQFAGAFVGMGLLKASVRSVVFEESNVCSPGVSPAITPLQGLLVEFTISFLLALICCGVWDARNKTKHDSVAIKFGLAISGLAIVGAPLTGAHMNMARTLAPAVINNTYTHIWVYMVGPLLGGFVAALLYRFAFDKEDVEEIAHRNIRESIPLNEKP